MRYFNTTSPLTATSASLPLTGMSLIDLNCALDALTSMRAIVKTTAHLANHMGREALEDFGDHLSDVIDHYLDALESNLASRIPADEAESADVADLIARIALTTRPGERGMNLRLKREAINV